jgi:hypothetical protein
MTMHSKAFSNISRMARRYGPESRTRSERTSQFHRPVRSVYSRQSTRTRARSAPRVANRSGQEVVDRVRGAQAECASGSDRAFVALTPRYCGLWQGLDGIECFRHFVQTDLGCQGRSEDICTLNPGRVTVRFGQNDRHGLVELVSGPGITGIAQS